MRSIIAFALAAILLAPPGFVAADDSTIEELARQIQELRELIERMEAEHAEEAAPGGEAIVEEKEGPSESELEQQLAEELGADPTQAEEQPEARGPRPLTVVSSPSGKSYMQISLDGLLAAGASSNPDVPNLQLGSHDPSRRGFTLQNMELVLNGAVDPYFTAQANIIFVESPEGETEVELEEIYATTTSLPHNLQAKAGHFFTEFGRLNPQHPHVWDFVDQPLSHARMFGRDNLRSSGVRLSWLMPVPFYSELLLTVQNAFGETLTSFGFLEGEDVFGRTLVDLSVRSLEDLLYLPRYTARLPWGTFGRAPRPGRPRRCALTPGCRCVDRTRRTACRPASPAARPRGRR